jgi:hypothetical protein
MMRWYLSYPFFTPEKISMVEDIGKCYANCTHWHVYDKHFAKENDAWSTWGYLWIWRNFFSTQMLQWDLYCKYFSCNEFQTEQYTKRCCVNCIYWVAADERLTEREKWSIYGGYAKLERWHMIPWGGGICAAVPLVQWRSKECTK